MVDIRHVKPMRALMLGKLVQRIPFSVNDPLLSESSHHEISVRQVAHYITTFCLLYCSRVFMIKCNNLGATCQVSICTVGKGLVFLFFLSQ